MENTIKVFDQWSNIPISEGEGPFLNDDDKDLAHKKHVDTAGWISPQDQLLEFQKAGESLESRRRVMYDFETP